MYLRQNTAVVSLPTKSYKDLSFPAFFPQRPPQGFKFDDNSISSKPNVLTYSFIYDHKPVYVSIQPLDPELDTGAFRPTREFETPNGHAYLATFDTRTTVAIVAKKSMILINSPEGVPDDLVERFANTLKPLH